jgi:hypothetical protein
VRTGQSEKANTRNMTRLRIGDSHGDEVRDSSDGPTRVRSRNITYSSSSAREVLVSN